MKSQARSVKNGSTAMLACRLPKVGGIRLAPMLAPSGRLVGDLAVMRLDADRFWLMGSYYLQSWHMRWFNDHLPEKGVEVKNLCGSWAGVSITGPDCRKLLDRAGSGRCFKSGISIHESAQIECR